MQICRIIRLAIWQCKIDQQIVGRSNVAHGLLLKGLLRWKDPIIIREICHFNTSLLRDDSALRKEACRFPVSVCLHKALWSQCQPYCAICSSRVTLTYPTTFRKQCRLPADLRQPKAGPKSQLISAAAISACCDTVVICSDLLHLLHPYC